MINSLLQELNEIFPASKDEVHEEYWKENIEYFLVKLTSISEFLFGAAGAYFPNRIFKESKIEYTFCQKPMLEVARVRLRPKNEYYSNSTLEIPRPENPNGKDATGLELELSLLRSYIAKNQLHPPSLCIGFNVWGFNEREALKDNFTDYRRTIDLLTNNLGLRIETACWFENLVTYNGNNIVKKLDLYFQNDDQESNISFVREFSVAPNVHEIIKVFLSLLAFYDSCYGYAKQRKDKNRLVHSRLSF